MSCHDLGRHWRTTPLRRKRKKQREKNNNKATETPWAGQVSASSPSSSIAITEGPRRRPRGNVPPHRNGIGWSRKIKKGVYEREVLYVLVMYVYKLHMVCVSAIDWPWSPLFIQLSKLHDAIRIASQRVIFVYTDVSIFACQPVEVLKPNVPRFKDAMPPKSVRSGHWLDASPEHHFETPPWRGFWLCYLLCFPILSIAGIRQIGTIGVVLFGAVRAFLGYLDLIGAHIDNRLIWDR